MKQRHKLQKRQRLKVERKVARDRIRPSRVFRVYPDPSLPLVVEVRVAPCRRRMRDAINYHDGPKTANAIERDCQGLVHSWPSPRTRRAGVSRPGRVVARMFLNVRDLRAQPSTIVPHECVHAAMAFARYRGTTLQRAQSDMAHEEVIAYAVGDLVRQINRHLFAMGVWP